MYYFCKHCLLTLKQEIAFVFSLDLLAERQNAVIPGHCSVSVVFMIISGSNNCSSDSGCRNEYPSESTGHIFREYLLSVC